VRRYATDVAVLARKDLTLELRARDTLPAMLLFVVSALVVFHFALPKSSSGLAAKGLLWVAIVFTALVGLTRAFVPEREQRLIDGLLLAPCDRSAIWLGKSVAVLAFLAAAEVVALPAYAAFFSGIGWSTIPTSSWPTSGSSRWERCSLPSRLSAARASCCCPCSSCRSRSRSWSAASAPASPGAPRATLVSCASTTSSLR